MKCSIRLVLPLIPITLAAALVVGCGESPRDRLERARAEFAGQDFAGARQDLIAALHKAPDDKAMLELLAQTLLRLNDPEGAQNSIERLKAQGMQGGPLARLEAEAALLFGKPDEALALIGRDAGSEAWRIRAAAWLRKEDVGRAIAAFEKGMAAGNNLRLASDYADFRLSLGDSKGAGKLLDRMRGFAPKAFETLMLSGRIAAREGRTGAAMKMFQQAGAAYPKRFEPLVAQAEMLERQGKFEAALKLVAQAKEMAPADAGVKAMQLRLLAMKGDWQKVRDILQPDEGKLDPRSDEGMIYGEALLRLGHAEQARALLSRTVLLAPENRHARMLLGQAQLATGDPVAAFETLQALIQGQKASPAELELFERAAREAGVDETEAAGN